MSKIVKFALVGAGRIGNVHAACLAENPLCELALVVDNYQPAAEALVARYGGSVGSLDDAFSSDKIDAVLIASSTDTHADYIEKAAVAGKAIFCEKPIDLSIERVKKCLDVVKENNATLFVGFNRRFDPSFQKLRENIKQNNIGNLEQVVITSRDPSPPPVEYIKISGGLFRDMMIHDLDMALWLLAAADDKPEEIYALGHAFVDEAIGKAGDIDTAMVLIKSQKGRQIHINNSRRATYGYDQRIEAHGSKGMVKADNELLTTTTLATNQGYESDVAKPFFLERYAQAYRNELNDFIESLSKQTAFSVNGDDGYNALLLAECALKSLETEAPVKIEL